MPEKVETGIQEYSQTEAALAELRERIGKTQYDVTVPASMDLARKDRRELVSLRTGLEAKRKEIKAPALEHCRLIDAESARITAELKKLEEPIDTIIKAEEARVEAERERKREIEHQRIADIQARIDIFRNAPLMAAGRTAEEIGNAIIKIGGMVINDSYQELVQDAGTAKVQCLAALNDLFTKKTDEEAAALQAEQERLDRERLEAEERERIRVEQEEMAARLEQTRKEQEAAQKELDRQVAEQAEALKAEREAFEAQQEAMRIQREAAQAEIEEREENLRKEAQKILEEAAERDRIRAEEMQAQELQLAEERAELVRQQEAMAETLRIQEEREEAELASKLMKEQVERQETQRLADEAETKCHNEAEGFDITLRFCGSVGWLGLTGDFRTGSHLRSAALALKAVEKHLATPLN